MLNGQLEICSYSIGDLFLFQGKAINAIHKSDTKIRPVQLKITDFRQNEIIQITNCTTNSVIEFKLQATNPGITVITYKRQIIYQPTRVNKYYANKSVHRKELKV